MKNMTALQKAHFVANARVAVLQGAEKVNCRDGDLICDIPGYFGYGTGMMALTKASQDLDVDFMFMDADDSKLKIHASTALENGAHLGLTVPLSGDDDESMMMAGIVVMHVYWLAKHNTLKSAGALVSDLAGVFDVSFGAGQSATAG